MNRQSELSGLPAELPWTHKDLGDADIYYFSGGGTTGDARFWLNIGRELFRRKNRTSD